MHYLSYASFLVVVSQAQTFQEDFEQERKDREKAHSKVAEIEESCQFQVESMVTQLDQTAQDLATTETRMHSQIELLSDRLCEQHEEVAAIVVENGRLQEELEQYKKQMDQYKEEIGALKQSAGIQQVHTCITAN